MRGYCFSRESAFGTSRKWCPSRLAAAHGYEADSVYELTPQYVTAARWDP